MIFLIAILQLATLLTAAYYYEQYLKISSVFKKVGLIEETFPNHKYVVKFGKITTVIEDPVLAPNAKLRWLVKIKSGEHTGCFGKVVVIMHDKSIFVEDLSVTKMIRVSQNDYVQRLHLRF
jgi:hypothetical protein